MSYRPKSPLSRGIVLEEPLISDEDGEFWGIPGHHSYRTLLRAISSETGMYLYEIVDNDLESWCAGVKQGWWKVTSRDDPSTWTDLERETMVDEVEDGGEPYWPHMWDDVYIMCDESDPGARPATVWRA